MRKLLLRFLLLCSVGVFSQEGKSQEVTIGSLTYRYSTGSKTASVLTGDSVKTKSFTIPASIKVDGLTYQVTSIMASAFQKFHKLESVTLSEGLTSIGDDAFDECWALRSINIPESMTSFGRYAFHFCSSLTSIHIPEGVTTLPEGVFDGTNIQKLELPSTLTKIEAFSISIDQLMTVISNIMQPFEISDNVFGRWVSNGPYGQELVSCRATLYVPAGTLTSYQQFHGWTLFESMKEGNFSKVKVGDLSYSYATNDKTATVSTGDYANLASVIVPSTITIDNTEYTVTEIGPRAFANCSKLTSVTLPQSITTIGEMAFDGCDGLVSLIIPEGVKTLGDQAFSNCRNLQILELPSTLNKIGSHVNGGTSGSCAIVSHIQDPFDIPADCFGIGMGNSGDGQMVIMPCDGALYIPDGTKAKYEVHTGWKMFSKIAEGRADIVKENEISYVCYSDDKTAKILQTINKDMREIHIQSEIKVENNSYRVVELCPYAFYEMPHLIEIQLPDGIETIGERAFAKCPDLQRVDLPAMLRKIGKGIFDEDYSLSAVVSRMTQPYSVDVENFALESHAAFHSINAILYVPSGTTEVYMNTPEWDIFDFISEDQPEYAAADGFKFLLYTDKDDSKSAMLVHGDYSNSENVEIPERIYRDGDQYDYLVKRIGGYAFGDCTNLKTVILPEFLNNIGIRSFYNTSLSEVTFPCGMKRVSDEAFKDCADLTAITVGSGDPFKIEWWTFPSKDILVKIPRGLKGKYVQTSFWGEFKNMKEIKEQITYAPQEETNTVAVENTAETCPVVEIPNVVTIEDQVYQVSTISEGAFENNTIVEQVMIPESVTQINDNAFAGCTELKEIRVYASEPIRLGSQANSRTRGTGSASVFEGVDTENCTLFVPAGSKEKYMQADGWREFKNIEEMGETMTITIGKSGKASYCGDKSLDFSSSEEVKAYIATGFDKDEGIIWLTRVKDVPAETPILIKGEPNQVYYLPVTDSQNSYYTNMFKGNTSGETVQVGETDGDKVNYYLSGDGTFKSVNKSVNIGNNKSYLQLPGSFETAVAGATQKVTIKTSGKASYAAPVDLDFTNVKGLKAFSATGYDKSSKTIWLTRVMKVQKGEGVLLKGDPKDYKIPSVAVQSSYMNMFVGNTTGDKIQVQEKSADGSQTNYYLNGDGAFVSVNGYVNIGNNKCYLELPTSMVAVASTRGAETNYILEEPEIIKMPVFRSIGNDGDGTTGIKDQSSKFNAPSDNAYYTLQGQRVEKPGKGLYIKNGKKIVIK